MMRTHGMTNTPEYSTWCEIIRRTENKACKCYNRYGGRGIKMCDRWRNDFLLFFEDMGKRPSKLHSIERVNNSGNYEASNCVWALSDVQVRNKRNNILIEFNGEVKILEDWARENHMTRSAFKTILRNNPNYKIIKNGKENRNKG